MYRMLVSALMFSIALAVGAISPANAQTLKGYEVWGSNQCWERYTDGSWGKQVDFAKCQSAIPVNPTAKISVNPAAKPATLKPGASTTGYKIWQSASGEECWPYDYANDTWGNAKTTLDKCGVTSAAAITYVFGGSGDGAACMEKYADGRFGNQVNMDKCGITTSYEATRTGMSTYCYTKYSNGVYGPKVDLNKCGLSMTYAFRTELPAEGCVEKYSNNTWGAYVQLDKCGLTRTYEKVTVNGSTSCYSKYSNGQRGLRPVAMSNCASNVSSDNYGYKASSDGKSCNEVNATGAIGTAVGLDKCGITITYEMRTNGNLRQCMEKYSTGATGNAVKLSQCGGSSNAYGYKSASDGKGCNEVNATGAIGTDVGLDKCGITMSYTSSDGKTCYEKYSPSNALGNKVGLDKCGITVGYESNNGMQCFEKYSSSKYGVSSGNKVGLDKCGITMSYTSSDGKTCYEKYSPSNTRGNQVALNHCGITLTYEARRVGFSTACIEKYSSGASGDRVSLDKCGIGNNSFNFGYNISDDRKECMEFYADGRTGNQVDLSNCNVTVTYALKRSGLDCVATYSTGLTEKVSKDKCNASAAPTYKLGGAGNVCYTQYSDGSLGTQVELGLCDVSLSYEVKNGTQCFEKYSNGAPGKQVGLDKCGVTLGFAMRDNKQCYQRYSNGVWGSAATLDKCGITIRYTLKTGGGSSICLKQYSNGYFEEAMLSMCGVADTLGYQIVNGKECWQTRTAAEPGSRPVPFARVSNTNCGLTMTYEARTSGDIKECYEKYSTGTYGNKVGVSNCGLSAANDKLCHQNLQLTEEYKREIKSRTDMIKYRTDCLNQYQEAYNRATSLPAPYNQTATVYIQNGNCVPVPGGRAMVFYTIPQIQYAITTAQSGITSEQNRIAQLQTLIYKATPTTKRYCEGL